MSVTGFYTEDEPSPSPSYSCVRKVHVVLQRTVTKCTKSYNARAQLFFSSLNLLLSDIAVAVAVAVASRLSALFNMHEREPRRLMFQIFISNLSLCSGFSFAIVLTVINKVNEFRVSRVQR